MHWKRKIIKKKNNYKKIKKLPKFGLAFYRKSALYHFVGKCSYVLQFRRNTLGVETGSCNI